MNKKILFNGKIKEKISISPFSSQINYGNGFFETILYKNNQLFFLSEHIDRMKQTSQFFKFEINLDYISNESTLNLLKINNLSDTTARIKILYFPNLNDQNYDILITTSIYKRKTDAFCVNIHNEINDSILNRFKSSNYHYNLYWKKFYTDKLKTDETLLLNSQKNVIEGTYTNILIIKDKTLYYCGKQNNYLQGIMQKQILLNYKEIGLNQIVSKEQGFSIDNLLDADEIILSNSLVIAKTVSQIVGYDKKFKSNHFANKIYNFF